MDVKSSKQDRIDRIAIAYVESHYDISTMSVSDFVDKFNEAGKEICDYLNGINVR